MDFEETGENIGPVGSDADKLRLMTLPVPIDEPRDKMFHPKVFEVLQVRLQWMVQGSRLEHVECELCDRGILIIKH